MTDDEPINANPQVKDISQLPTRQNKNGGGDAGNNNDIHLPHIEYRQKLTSKISKYSFNKNKDKDIVLSDADIEDIVDNEEEEEDDDDIEPVDSQEVYDLISSISDPEHPLSLGQLSVVNLGDIHVRHPNFETGRVGEVNVQITPTITHCSLATLIGLGIRVRLDRSIDKSYRIGIYVKEGTHQSEGQVNKQLNDKERVCAACENPQMSEAQAAYTPQEVEAALEQAVASAEAQIEDLIAQEGDVEEKAAIEAESEEIAEELVAEAAAEAEAEAVAEAVLEEAVAEAEKQLASTEDDEEDEDEDDEDDSDYDDDDFDPADETVFERIEALKDIFSPKQREFFSNSVSNIVSGSKYLTLNFGSALWYIATTSMLVGVPLAVAILNETQLTELEKELNGAGLGVPAPAAPAAPVVEEKK
ncbi:hypothetical protein C6P42_003882 [Pichia californica]|nr:hypothetical protein C6P42_003882 [[Candida] californica]